MIKNIKGFLFAICAWIFIIIGNIHDIIAQILAQSLPQNAQARLLLGFASVLAVLASLLGLVSSIKQLAMSLFAFLVALPLAGVMVFVHIFKMFW